jgi:beta-glucanase (GH16 family)
MKTLLKNQIAVCCFVSLLVSSCGKAPGDRGKETENQPDRLRIDLIALDLSEDGVRLSDDGSRVIIGTDRHLSFELNVAVAGRYTVTVEGSGSVVWLEDYVGNPDDRTYNITGNINLGSGQSGVDGTPLNLGQHKMRLHAREGDAQVSAVRFDLIRPHEITPVVMTQQIAGENWEIVWADEFDGQSVDTANWTYDIGDWGWGNNELQYYTVNRPENARIEDGALIIEARKNDMGVEWTSARLTTRGKVSFLYGKIELRAKVPRERGNWAAGWTLGDSYVDEKDWPYCGEIDILESVGYEVNDETGDGIAHATVHTPAYYFKINNQISSTREVRNIAGEWHTYAVEWTPTEIKGLVDGEVYYLYDKIADEREWPFNQPQNIIVNLAMGGGWGGAQGMDTTVTSQQFILDYVRVYERR